MKAVKAKLGYSWEEIASKAGVSGRTLRDWQREILLGKKEILSKLSRLSGVSLPLIVEEREEWWNTRAWSKKASIIRMKMYGPPGTPEGRVKGGKMSQLYRKLYPERYMGTNVVLRNTFNFPENTVALAEFIGIMLGDGGVGKYQAIITLDAKADKEYVNYVVSLMNSLFGVKPSLYLKKENVVAIHISGVELIGFLLTKGLCIGSKLRANIGLPDWIIENLNYSKACIRGLVDTDGCFFKHKYQVREKQYEYKKIAFVSYIPRLITDVKKQLLLLGFNPKIQGEKRLFLYNQSEAMRYLEEIGTSNPKNLERWK